MKKTTTTTPRGDGAPATRSKLRLKVQTLRVLDSAELRLVQGGLGRTDDGGQVSRDPNVAC